MSEREDLQIELHHHWALDTEAAYCCSREGDIETKKPLWLPKSECSRGRRTGRADPVYVFDVPEWLAEREGLEP